MITHETISEETIATIKFQPFLPSLVTEDVHAHSTTQHVAIVTQPLTTCVYMAIDYMCVYGHQTEHYSLSGGVCYMYTYIVLM